MCSKDKILSFDIGVQCLSEGKLVIYPTETFFAVGCALNAFTALERLYEAKNRPKLRPIPVLAASMEQVDSVAILTDIEKKLALQFWPGPLTLICKARENVPHLVSAGTGRIAVRVTSHPVAKLLAASVNSVLVSSSANISGEPAVSNCDDLSAGLLAMVDGVILGEPNPEGGLASTLVEVLESGLLNIRRHGAVSVADLVAQGWSIR